MDCNIFSRDMLEPEFQINFKKPWIVEDEINQWQFDTEIEACSFQRMYRIGKGLNPITGE